MKKRLNQIVIVALLIMPFTTLVAQQRGYGAMADGRGSGQFMGPAGPGVSGIPDLTDEQKEKIKELHLNMTKEALPLRNQLGENRARMRTLQTSENPDMKAIESLIDESAKIEADLKKKMAATHQEVRKILTDEQRVIFDSREPQMRARGPRGMQREGERGVRHRNRLPLEESDN